MTSLRFALVLAASAAAGCACSATGLDHPRPDPDAAVLPIDAAAPDAAVLPDAAALPDAGPPSDAGPPAPGCFDGEVTLATHTFDPAGRPHLHPIALFARPRGWTAVYEFYGAPHTITLDEDGRPLAVDELVLLADAAVQVAPATLVLTSPLRRVDVALDGSGATVFPAIDAAAFDGTTPDDQAVLATELQPGGVLRVLTQRRSVLTDLRLLDLALEDGGDGLRVVHSRPFSPTALPYQGTFAIRGDTIRGVLWERGAFRAILAGA